jgi:hypothetical protein
MDFVTNWGFRDLMLPPKHRKPDFFTCELSCSDMKVHTCHSLIILSVQMEPRTLIRSFDSQVAAGRVPEQVTAATSRQSAFFIRVYAAEPGGDAIRP